MRRGYLGGTKATVLAADAQAADSSLTASDITTWAGITTNGKFAVTVNRGRGNEEQILVTTIDTATGVMSTVTRGYAGSVAVFHAAGETLEVTSTYIDFDEANAHINAANHPLTDTANTYTATQRFAAATNYLGPYTGGATTGTRLKVTSTPATVQLVGESDGATPDVSIYLQGKGTGSLLFLKPDGTHGFSMNSTGVLRALGADAHFGPSAEGAGGGELHLSVAGTSSYVLAEDATGNQSLILKPQGTGRTELHNSAGNPVVTVGTDGIARALAFFDGTLQTRAQATITGSRGGNAALADLLTTLDTFGLITNSTSA